MLSHRANVLFDEQLFTAYGRASATSPSKSVPNRAERRLLGSYWVRVQMLCEIRTALLNPYTHQMPFGKSVYASIRHLRTLFVCSARLKLTPMAREEEAYRRRLERQKAEATAVELSLGAGVVGARTSMARDVMTHDYVLVDPLQSLLVLCVWQVQQRCPETSGLCRSLLKLCTRTFCGQKEYEEFPKNQRPS